jgi:outer membrane protein assembly factor BamB
MSRSRCAWLALVLGICGLVDVGCSSTGGDDDPNEGGGGALPGAGTGGAGVTPPPGGSGSGSGGSVASGGGGGNVTPAGTGGGGAGTGAGGGAAGSTPGAGTGGTSGDPGGASWPQMGYDERNWYFNPNETKLTVANAATVVEKWRYHTGGFPPGTAVIGDGKVFVMATVGTHAIDLVTGTEAWKRMDLGGTASVAWEPGFVYVHAYQPAALYKLNSADGTTVWGPVNTNPNAMCTGGSSPIVGGGKVIVGRECGPLEIGFGAAGAKGGLFAANTSDGTMAWQYDTVAAGEDGAMVWSSVGIDVAGGMVFAATGNNYTMGGGNSDSIHAINLSDGMKAWSKQVRTGDTWSLFSAPTGPDTDFGANPVIAEIGGMPMVAAGDKGSAFWAMSRGNGTIAWMREGLSAARDQAHGGFLMNSSFDGSTFYGLVNDTSNRSARLVALNATDGTDKFPAKVFSGVFAWAAPSIANGVLIAPVDSSVYVLDAANGTELKKIETMGTIAAGAVSIADGNLVISSGLMYQLDATAKPNDEVICWGL